MSSLPNTSALGDIYREFFQAKAKFDEIVNHLPQTAAEDTARIEPLRNEADRLSAGVDSIETFFKDKH